MLLALFLISLVGAFYLYIVRNNDFWKKRNVPYVEPNFLFGNFKEILMGTKHFGEVYTEIYRKFEDARYVGHFKMTVPGLILKDPELIKNVMIRDFESFCNNDFRVDRHADPLWSENIFGQTGEMWKTNRRLWLRGMTPSKIKAMFDGISGKSESMVAYLKNHIKKSPNEPFESKTFFTNSIMVSILGLETSSFQNKDDPFRKITTSLFDNNIWANFVMVSFIAIPWFGQMLKLRFTSMRAQKQIDVVARDLLKSRLEAGLKKDNTYDALLLSRGTPNSISDKDAGGVLFGFLLDGTETSAGLGGYMLYSLAVNQHVQDKLRAEIDAAVKAKNGKLLYEDVHQMKYLDMTISETLRMYSPALALQRLCTKPYVMPPPYPGGDPVTIPVGTPVIIPVHALHMDPKYFPDPEKFDPERFNDENKNNIQKQTYLPFGDGPRICLGNRLALNQLKIGVVALVKNFEIRLASSMVDKPLKVYYGSFILRAVGGLWVTLHERRS